MTLVADSSALLALYNADDRRHAAVTAIVRAERSAVVISAAILAEIDYLLLDLLGWEAEMAFLRSLRSGAFHLERLLPEDLDRALALLTEYRGLNLGLADAAVMATAERLGTDRILTLDRRHFSAVTSRQGQPFRLLPSESP